MPAMDPRNVEDSTVLVARDAAELPENGIVSRTFCDSCEGDLKRLIDGNYLTCECGVAVVRIDSGMISGMRVISMKRL